MTLQQLSINHWHQDIRTRGAGVLMLGQRLKVPVIAKRLGVSEQAVYNWSHAWRDCGVAGLLGGHKGGRPRAMNDEMIAAAVRIAAAEPLTRADIFARLEAEFGPLNWHHLDTLSNALKSAGLTFKRNRLSLKKSVTKRSLR
ncbi:transposase [Burkholderia sp. HI2714]|nr:transposase [Burkholderia sp. HI2714]